jgi:hypothetical protein
MANWGADPNRSQWGAYPPQQAGYYPVNDNAPAPGYAPQYAPPPPPPQAAGGYGNEKDPYANGRFKPKKKVNDIFFLIFFVAQVRVLRRVLVQVHVFITDGMLVPRLCSALWSRLERMDQTGWPWRWCG